jgi:FMN-dependent NADH-azoreductase
VVQEDQLNGGSFAVLDEADWLLIEPYLEENARQFGISSAQLLTVDGVMHKPAEVYRKVRVGTAESLLTEAENR